MLWKRAAQVLLASATVIVLQGAALAESFQLSSPQLSNGEFLPKSMEFAGFGCDGNNLSPELNWSGAPVGTKSFVVTMYDPDAPTGVGWWHWLLFNLPADVARLSQGAGTEAGALLPAGSQQGYTDYGSSAFGGACPPVGDVPHRYAITLYALDVERLPTGAETTGAKLSYLMRGHILGETTLYGFYKR